MLFDLKGRRKRLIQVVYVILAVLFGGGLILFGVGSGVQGGLLDAVTGDGTTASNTFTDDVERAQRAVRANPKNDRAWLALAKAEYQSATTGDDFDSATGQFKEGATGKLKRAVNAWERYLALDPKRPDSSTALLVVQAYATLLAYGIGGSALDLFENAANAQRIVAEDKPSPIAWFQLSSIYYAIGSIEKGDKAADKAVELTPSDQRNTVRAQIADARKQGITAKKEVKRSEEQAAKAAKDAREAGQDPFAAPPGQSPLGGSPAP